MNNGANLASLQMQFLSEQFQYRMQTLRGSVERYCDDMRELWDYQEFSDTAVSDILGFIAAHGRVLHLILDREAIDARTLAFKGFFAQSQERKNDVIAPVSEASKMICDLKLSVEALISTHGVEATSLTESFKENPLNDGRATVQALDDILFVLNSYATAAQDGYHMRPRAKPEQVSQSAGGGVLMLAPIT